MAAPARTLAVAVHRPLAEQLVDLAALQSNERVLEVSAGDGELTRRLRERWASASVTVEVVDRAQSQRSPLSLAFAPASFDVALSLLALESGNDLAGDLAELARVAHRARIVVWEDGAAHENALHSAWPDAGGSDESAPVRGPVPPAALPPGWSRIVLADVARFDSVGQLWAALTIERGIDVPARRARVVRERFAHHLAPFTAADGTLRVPVRASLLALR
jgi:hypothetical protein